MWTTIAKTALFTKLTSGQSAKYLLFNVQQELNLFYRSVIRQPQERELFQHFVHDRVSDRGYLWEPAVGLLLEVEHVVALHTKLVLVHVQHDLAVLSLEVAGDRYRERGLALRRLRAQHVRRFVAQVDSRDRPVARPVPE